jgi:hypothetical protein
MATLQQIRLTCPVCPAEFESRTLAGYTCLRKRTDFHEQPSGPAVGPRVRRPHLHAVRVLGQHRALRGR